MLDQAGYRTFRVPTRCLYCHKALPAGTRVYAVHGLNVYCEACAAPVERAVEALQSGERQPLSYAPRSPRTITGSAWW